MATSIGTNYDPPSTAAALAEAYVSSRQSILTMQAERASATGSALTKLRSAISAYQSSLLALSSSKTMLSRTATFSNTAIGTATAGATATAGTYSFFVEKLATAHQVAFSAIPDSPMVPAPGSFDIKVGTTSTIKVDLAGADSDGNATLTAREIAAAINAAPDNAGKVSASIVTINGVAELVLSAQATGAASAISVDAALVADPALKASLAAVPREMSKAEDALVWLGAKDTGSPIAQASNTFTNVDGVSMTFTKAQAVGEAPVTLTVASDNAGTTANVQKFIDDYNKLKSAIDAMVNPGDPKENKAAGAFSDDGGVRALQGRLVSILRQPDPSGTTLAAYGIIAARDGTLSLDSARLTKQLALNPNGLDALVGSASAGSPSGIAGNLDTYLKQWTSSVNGQIKQRQEANTRLQSTLTMRQAQIDSQYDNAYKRYLAQFTQLQAMQSQMSSNVTMFEAMFGQKSD
jgi:flagellar hook-associated protein 2